METNKKDSIAQELCKAINECYVMNRHKPLICEPMVKRLTEYVSMITVSPNLTKTPPTSSEVHFPSLEK